MDSIEKLKQFAMEYGGVVQIGGDMIATCELGTGPDGTPVHMVLVGITRKKAQSLADTQKLTMKILPYNGEVMQVTVLVAEDEAALRDQIKSCTDLKEEDGK